MYGSDIVLDDGIHDDLEDDLDVAGVGCRGEVGVDDLTTASHLVQEHGLDEVGGRVNVIRGTCKYNSNKNIYKAP